MQQIFVVVVVVVVVVVGFGGVFISQCAISIERDLLHKNNILSKCATRSLLGVHAH